MFSFRDAGSQYIHKINADNFDNIALALFRYQYEENAIYRSFVDALGIAPASITDLCDIPFLPISFFKTHAVCSGRLPGDAILTFESSGTTGEIPSRHYIFSKEIYDASLLRGFETFYGAPSAYTLLALLPSYLERKNASLVHMATTLMEQSAHAENGFYLDEWEKLHRTLALQEERAQPTLLLGVSFALLDFAAAYPASLQHTIVMETGGMKGRREEWTRAEVHQFLNDHLGTTHIHSEYGMTELLSQAYSKEKGRFSPAPTMKVLVRDINDPLEVTTHGNGCINIIDLANVDSCAFIATEDLGSLAQDGTFEILGRMDHAALRGCSLMVL